MLQFSYITHCLTQTYTYILIEHPYTISLHISDPLKRMFGYLRRMLTYSLAYRQTGEWTYE